MPASDASPSRRFAWLLWLLMALLATSGFFHLDADFPNHSRWIDDAAKFTDEGWYAAGALNRILTGHWLRPGDFNPMVTIPLWSVLLAIFFHFTGISLVLARALAFSFTLGTVLLVGLLFAREHRQLVPRLMLLVLASPPLFFFSRIAILEPALIFFLLASSLAAYTAISHSFAQTEAPGVPPSQALLLASGAMFVLAILAKSSAVFGAPALFYLLWFPLRRQPRQALRTIAIPLIAIVVLYGVYWCFMVRTHPDDVRVLYNQNVPYLGLRSIPKAFRIVYRSFTWIDPILYPVAILGVIASFGPLRKLWNDPLFGFAILAYAGYSGFLLVHFDAGPRYFTVLVPPVIMVVLLFQQALQQRSAALGTALNAVLVFAAIWNIVAITRMIFHPSYTLRDANLAIRQQIDSNPTAKPLVIGHGALESTFITRIPALSDIGTMPVITKFATFHPGWLVEYSSDLGILNDPSIGAQYNFVEKGKYPVLDQSQRQALLLYRIVPK